MKLFMFSLDKNKDSYFTKVNTEKDKKSGKEGQQLFVEHVSFFVTQSIQCICWMFTVSDEQMKF